MNCLACDEPEGATHCVGCPEDETQKREILLSNGMTATVDGADYAELSKHTWQAQKVRLHGRDTFYAARSLRVDGKKQTVLMHRQIMGEPQGLEVDHADCNGLNNSQETNLRIATKSQNAHNRRKRRNTSSHFKGVYWDKSRNKWRSRIVVDKKTKHLGLFDSEYSAALAYDTAAALHFGVYARLNFLCPACAGTGSIHKSCILR